MKVTYTGRQVELAPAQLKKIEAKLAKLGKLLDGKEQQEVRVILSVERHLHHAEVTLNLHDHPLVGVAASGDLFTAIHGAVEKLEKQAIKVRAKWRETSRTPRKEIKQVEPEGTGGPVEAEAERQIFRVNHHQKRKPMALEEAVLELEKGLDYLVYNDSERGRVSVLVRRRDGNLDLVEA